jgi:hypothetical protein
MYVGIFRRTPLDGFSPPCTTEHRTKKIKKHVRSLKKQLQKMSNKDC